MSKTLLNFFISLLVFILIVDPGDLVFHLKMPLFVIILGLWGFLKVYTPIKVNKDIVIISFTFIAIPLLGIVSAVVQDNMADVTFAFGFIKSFSVIILILIIFDLNVPMDKYLVRNSLIVPLIIIPVYIFLSLNPSAIGSIFTYLSEKDVAKFSNRDFYGYKVVMLYYRTSPLLVFPLAYYCNSFVNGHKRLLSFCLAGLFLFTLMLSGTRANMLSGVAISVFFLFSYLRNLRNKLPLVIVSIWFVIIGAWFIQSLSFSQGDDSSDVKAGHLNSYKQLFDEYPKYLIWGQGLGAEFYSSGNRNIVPQTELTYFDLVRWFGIPIAMILVFLLIYPMIYLYLNKKIDVKNRYLIPAYLAYLFIAGTNPLLVSSTGILAIITMYSFVRLSPSPSYGIVK